ncbi:hypothetical protein QZJ86_06605 [Methylomonas montana]|uniref:tetratricopeptide repeat protein n=1 Tax=Methylomonas montana TaxID=3058963 RepID=UPI00265B083E|nr:hypothetical protein [Methylomonas montana]WKJ91804.1 hypothetical protein QZJ86_06605 [Methylomonas montana]
MTENTTRTLAELQQLAEVGDAQAQFELAHCLSLSALYSSSALLHNNIEPALSLLGKAAEHGYADAQFSLGLYWLCNQYDALASVELKQWAIEKHRDAAKEIALFLIITSCGNIEGNLTRENLQSLFYIDSEVTKKILQRRLTVVSDDQAFNWLTAAVQQGHSEAAFFRDVCYPENTGTLQNQDAMLMRLANAYVIGLNDIAPNPLIALQYFEELAKYSEDECLAGEACFRAAVMYFDENGAKQDYKKGMKYLRDAINLKHAGAMQRWENAFLQFTFPEFIGRENEEVCFRFAFDWCEKRLREVADDYEATFAMGVLLAFGRGCRAESTQAEAYFQKIHGEVNSVGMVANDESNDLIFWMASFYLACKQNWGNGFAYLDDPRLVAFFKADSQATSMQINPNLVIPALIIDFSRSFNDIKLLQAVLDSFKLSPRREHAALQLSMRDKLAEALLDAEAKRIEASEQQRRAEHAEYELEQTMSMFAHKFRSPLDAILYNSGHEHQPKLYIQAAQTMQGLLDIFSLISTDADKLQDRLKQDRQGEGNLVSVFGKTLDMVLLHLLSPSAKGIIRQHYLGYAKAHDLCDAGVSTKQWYEDYREMEQQLQHDWEQSYAQLLGQSATLEPRLAWLEQRFFKLELLGFGRINIQFEEYGITESLLTIVFNEFLINAFKYYASVENSPVVLNWVTRDDHQVLVCRNPSTRHERTRIKGSGKGHIFLSALARKIGSEFIKPKPADDFVVEFSLADELLISTLDDKQ